MSEPYSLYVFPHPNADDQLAREVATLSGANAISVIVALEEGGTLERSYGAAKAKELAQALGLLGVIVELRANLPLGQTSRVSIIKQTETRQIGNSRIRSFLFSFVTTLLAVGVLGLSPWRTQASPLPGMSAPAEPIQGEAKLEPFEYQNYRITPLASYEVTARVLGRKEYSNDKSSSLSPVDLALGWGVMSDATILADLRITQSERWFYVYWQNAYVDVNQVMTSSANTHILPSDETVARQLKNVQRDDVVHLQGYLVEVTNKDGFLWRSSLRRDDTGDGSCEILWVTGVNVVPPAQLQAQR
jgi:hypothetical protein